MKRPQRKTLATVIGLAAVVATPAIAQAANLGAELSWTTTTSGSKAGAEWLRTGSMKVCGDIINSSSLAGYGIQLKRDLFGVPDPIIASKDSTYNAGSVCSPSATGVQGNTYYTRAYWTTSESIWHYGYAQSQS